MGWGERLRPGAEWRLEGRAPENDVVRTSTGEEGLAGDMDERCFGETAPRGVRCCEAVAPAAGLTCVEPRADTGEPGAWTTIDEPEGEPDGGEADTPGTGAAEGGSRGGRLGDCEGKRGGDVDRSRGTPLEAEDVAPEHVLCAVGDGEREACEAEKGLAGSPRGTPSLHEAARTSRLAPLHFGAVAAAWTTGSVLLLLPGPSGALQRAEAMARAFGAA